MSTRLKNLSYKSDDISYKDLVAFKLESYILELLKRKLKCSVQPSRAFSEEVKQQQRFFFKLIFYSLFVTLVLVYKGAICRLANKKNSLELDLGSKKDSQVVETVIHGFFQWQPLEV